MSPDQLKRNARYRVSRSVMCVPIGRRNALGHDVILRWVPTPSTYPKARQGRAYMTFEIVGFDPTFTPRGSRYPLCTILNHNMHLEEIQT